MNDQGDKSDRHGVLDAKRLANLCRRYARVDTEVVKMLDPLWCASPSRPLHAAKRAEAFLEPDDVDAGS